MENIAFTFGNTKETSLYFDHVVPLGLWVDAVKEYGSEEFYAAFDNPVEYARLLETRGLFDEFLPPEIKRGSPLYELWADVNFNMMIVVAARSVGRIEVAKYRQQWFKETVAEEESRHDGLIARFLADLGVRNASFTTGIELVSNSTSSTDDVAVTIANLNLIDASRASVEQILEFRKDAEARTKLRRLRSFSLQNYSGKSRALVEDDLSVRIADCEEAIRSWGFETRHAAMSMLFNSKLLGGAAGGSLIAALFGSPTISLGAIGTGIVIEAAKITLEISRKKFEARAALRENPVSYILHAGEKLRDGS